MSFSSPRLLSPRGSPRGQQQPKQSGVFVSVGTILKVAVGLSVLIVFQNVAMANWFHKQEIHKGGHHHHAAIPSILEASKSLFFSKPETVSVNQQHKRPWVDPYDHPEMSTKDNEECRFYMGPSAIPGGGLGVFAGTGLLPGETIAIPDICIMVGDAPRKWTQLRSHTWGRGKFFGSYEGANPRAACEGVSTTLNTNPDMLLNTAQRSPVLATNAGLDRATQPGAGAITHWYGISSVALDVITPGSEFTHYYGDWTFDENKEYTTPKHSMDYLKKEGWCADNIEVKQANDPSMGRGAFATKQLQAGQVVTAAPLQCFRNRQIFQRTTPEQLYVNYCLQPEGSDMIFYPYGVGVNLINHDSVQPNVEFRWAKNKSAHHSDWLDMSYKKFWEVTTPGGLVLEVVALRDILPGEELFLNYGESWENAWNEHVANWKPVPNASNYVYPQDIDESAPLRTVKEQKKDPYPDNLITMCATPDHDREDSLHIDWWDAGKDTKFSDSAYEPDLWWEYMRYCHIMDKTIGPKGDYVYQVEIDFSYGPDIRPYDPEKPMARRFIDSNVPRRASKFDLI